MIRNRKFLSLFAVICMYGLVCNAQGRKLLKIKVYKNILEVTDVASIGNMNTKEEGKIEEHHMILKVKAGDQLVVTAPDCELTNYEVTPEDILNHNIKIHLKTGVVVLDEVEVTHFNTPSLINDDVKKYTKGERKLKAASEGKYGKAIVKFLTLQDELKLPLDPLINVISGRTKRLKKELKIEQKQHLVTFINENYDEFIAANIVTNKEEVNAFIYYIVEQPDADAILNIKSRAKAAFFFLKYYEAYQKDKVINEDK